VVCVRRGSSVSSGPCTPRAECKQWSMVRVRPSVEFVTVVHVCPSVTVVHVRLSVEFVSCNLEWTVESGPRFCAEFVTSTPRVAKVESR
jgi:hypothetical protein